MTVFSLLSPPLPCFPHLLGKGSRRKRGKQVQHMVADIPPLTLNRDFKMVPLFFTCKVPTKLPRHETNANLKSNISLSFSNSKQLPNQAACGIIRPKVCKLHLCVKEFALSQSEHGHENARFGQTPGSLLQ